MKTILLLFIFSRVILSSASVSATPVLFVFAVFNWHRFVHTHNVYHIVKPGKRSVRQLALLRSTFECPLDVLYNSEWGPS